MTAPDVRTAAQAEAERQFIPRDRPTMVTETVAVQSFIDGAVWGAALVTPTREQIAVALWDFPENIITLAQLNELAEQGEGDYREHRDYVYAQADAVLALMQDHTKGD